MFYLLYSRKQFKNAVSNIYIFIDNAKELQLIISYYSNSKNTCASF
jgi:hypothetical protein